jgi:hypothetical protein
MPTNTARKTASTIAGIGVDPFLQYPWGYAGLIIDIPGGVLARWNKYTPQGT